MTSELPFSDIPPDYPTPRYDRRPVQIIPADGWSAVVAHTPEQGDTVPGVRFRPLAGWALLGDGTITGWLGQVDEDSGALLAIDCPGFFEYVTVPGHVHRHTVYMLASARLFGQTEADDAVAGE